MTEKEKVLFLWQLCSRRESRQQIVEGGGNKAMPQILELRRLLRDTAEQGMIISSHLEEEMAVQGQVLEPSEKL